MSMSTLPLSTTDNNMVALNISVIWFLFFVEFRSEWNQCNAFSINVEKLSHFKTTRKIISSARSLTPNDEVMGGVILFDEWWSKIEPKNKVRHSSFEHDQLRGLEYVGNGNAEKEIVKVPRRFAIRSPYPDNDKWDSNLAVTLLKECMLGGKSDIYGYCYLLTKGNDYSNLPSTSPDALRHWTEGQRSILENSSSGKKVCVLADTQKQNWIRKYETLPSQDKAKITLDQFFWAMEAVHSRAFYGDFGARGDNGSSNVLVSILIPIIASGAGVFALLNTTYENSEYIAIACAIAILAQTIFLLSSNKKQNDAVMLPFIDSANHIQEADSLIEFDPLTDSFTLSIGPKCLVSDVENKKKQLFISYGIKTDKELLINYGFLPGVQSKDILDLDETSKWNIKRRTLAEEYLKRNP